MAFGAAAVQKLVLLPVLAGITVAVIALVQPPRGWVQRLRAPLVVALCIVAILPFFGTGPALFQIGPLGYATGAAEPALLMAARLMAIAALVLALVSGLSDVDLVAALRGVRVPTILCDLTLLTLRYLHELRAELARVRLARRLRGGKSGWRDLPEFGALLAVVMIRALQRSEHVWAAMRVRGYHTTLSGQPAPMSARDIWAIAGAVLTAFALIGSSL